MNLRPYQSAMVESVRAAIRSGARAPLLQAPTGSGKTIIAKAITEAANAKGNRVLFLAPRRELIFQVCEKLHSAGIRHGVIMSGEARNQFAEVQVACVPTIYHRAIKSERMVLPPADVVIIDEAHLSLAKMCESVLAAYPKAIKLGLTATPARGDGKGLGLLYDRLVLGPSVAELTERGYLVPARYFAPSKPDLAGIKISMGDYNQKQLGSRMDQPQLVGDVVTNWLRIASDRPTVVFAVNRPHSRHLRDSFRDAGIAAEHLDGETPNDERAAIIARLASGETQVICNCASGETRLITQEHGSVALMDVRGEFVTVRCADGNWRTAEVMSFGEQHLNKITFETAKNGWKHYREEFFTPNHRWILSDGSVTQSLKVGDVLHGLPPESDFDPHAVVHGVLFGDGSMTGGPIHKTRRTRDQSTSIQGARYATIRVCTQDAVAAEITRWMERCGYKASKPSHAGGDSVFYIGKMPFAKCVPFTRDPSYIAGFIYGWWLADGVKGESPETRTIHSIDAESIEWLKDHAVYAGLTVLKHTTSVTRGPTYKNAKPLHCLRLKAGMTWRVAGIEDSGRREEVFCAVEPVTKSFTLASQIVTGNCDVLTYGWDSPKVSCAVLAKPTKSIVRYLQMVGRVLRPFDGKADCIVIDHAGAVEEIGFVDDDFDWKLSSKGKVEKATRPGEKKAKAVTCGECSTVFEAAKACPHCGHEIPASTYREAVETIDADLAELERGKKRRNREWTNGQKARFYGELKAFASERRFSAGWAANAYRDRMGVWPNAHRDAPACEPSPETRAWCNHKLIRYAKSKKKQQEAA